MKADNRAKSEADKKQKKFNCKFIVKKSRFLYNKIVARDDKK